MDLSEFPESEIIGSDYSDVDYKYMRAAAEQSSKISKDEWEKILDEHSKFIKAGGGNGSWQTMNLNGVVLGLYSGSKIDIGSHALLNNRSLSNLKLSKVMAICSCVASTIA